VLSIGKLALGQQAYYAKQVTRGRDDYYSGRGEAGEWVGSGAGELGLDGPVSAGEFTALEGRDPRAPETRLRASSRQPEVAALDLTFSAPKSVSVMFAVAARDASAALVECHEEAVKAALSFLEDEAVFVRRGKGGVRFEHAGGLIAAAYCHRMSRSLDPQLHTHVVAANLARGEDGRFTALHHPSIYRAARTAGYLYQAHLRAAVRDRLGLEWGSVVKGAAELQDVPVEVLRVFSQRRAEVQAAVEQREAELGRSLSRAERATFGVIATRDRKDYGVDTHTWREEITARAAEHGLDRELVERVIGNATERLRSGEIQADAGTAEAARLAPDVELGDELTGPNGLTQFANTFDQGSVLREFAAAAEQGVRVATVREQTDRFLARHDVLASGHGTFTTAGLVDREHALIDTATSTASSGVGVLDPGAVATTLSRSDRNLNADQEAAVRQVTGSGNGVDVVEALAGTGKTYTAGVLREVYEQAGYTVIGVAPSARAARELAELAGIPSRRLDSRLLAVDHGHDLPARAVVIFDEAGMASTRQSERLLAYATKVGGKVIAIGDHGQLPSVQAGGWLKAISERLGSARLTEVMRQRDPRERQALAGLHDGNPERWLDWATSTGRIEVLADGLQVLERAVEEWGAGADAHGLDQSVLIARDNETRRALNRLVRERRRAAGELGDERTYGPVTVAVGDRVICRSNERDLDVDNGTRGTVRHVHQARVVIETDAHIVRDLPAGYVADHLEHAYALTGHGMQGATVEQATIVASPHDLTRGWAYTALSRARGETRLLVRDTSPEAGDRDVISPTAAASPAARPVDVLARVASRMRERDDEDLAIDQLPAGGRHDDPQLGRPPGGPVQEHAAVRAEPAVDAAPGPARMRELRDALQKLQAQLAGLPTRELDQLDSLDREAIELTERRDTLRDNLERIPDPPRRRFGRNTDTHIVKRTQLASALHGIEAQLDRALAGRAAIARVVGDVDQIRSERDDRIRAITALRREQRDLRDDLADREVHAGPGWLRDALGERPDGRSAGQRWDRAAQVLGRYRVKYDIPADAGDALDREPADSEQRHDYAAALRVCDRFLEAQRDLPGLGLSGL
jgi:conjugative relaxase-like TrwC/TraI family protein